MATIMLMHWPEVTKAQYEAARKEVNWEKDVAKGGKFHVSWFASDGLHVLDLWDSPQDFQRFVETRLAPVTAKLGIKTQPKVEFAESHAIFAPNV
ncbi:MAG TPA: hypothetical protein VN914_15085 [Polyangia bacterium]|nr:hypothetical protein [Polyangia bacterium]